MRLSVVICTYNGAAYLAEQLESILHQTVPVDEIILSDDGSSDGTVALAEALLKDAGVSYKILCNRSPKGVAANFLGAMKCAGGDYVFTCDQDDIWFPDKVQQFLTEAEKSSAQLYFSDGILVNGSGAPLGTNLWEAYDISLNTLTSAPLLPILLRRPVVTGAAMMVSRGLISSVDSIPEGFLHDEWFAVCAALRDGAIPLPNPTFYYRQHGGNVIGAKRLSFADRLKKWLKGFQTLQQLREANCAKLGAILAAGQDSPYAPLLREAYDFWLTMKQLNSLGRGKRISVILQCYRNGSYQRFYTGKRGCLRDGISALLTAKGSLDCCGPFGRLR